MDFLFVDTGLVVSFDAITFFVGIDALLETGFFVGLFCSTTLGFFGFCGGGRSVFSFIVVVVVLVVGFLLVVVFDKCGSLFFSGNKDSFLWTTLSLLLGIVVELWMTGFVFGASSFFEFFTCIERPKT
jgi:hypothetical protein